MIPPPTVTVGRLIRAHGVRGEIVVDVLTEVASRFAPGSVLSLDDGTTMTVVSARNDRGKLLVTFREVRDREHARSLGGRTLTAPASTSPELPEGTWWEHQIVGCDVITEDGRDLGAVTEVLRTSANDVWSVSRDGVETLVPAIADAIVSVDVGARRIVVRSIPGLTAPDLDDAPDAPDGVDGLRSSHLIPRAIH